jgi:hypothetical protein
LVVLTQANVELTGYGDAVYFERSQGHGGSAYPDSSSIEKLNRLHLGSGGIRIAA